MWFPHDCGSTLNRQVPSNPDPSTSRGCGEEIRRSDSSGNLSSLPGWICGVFQRRESGMQRRFLVFLWIQWTQAYYDSTRRINTAVRLLNEVLSEVARELSSFGVIFVEGFENRYDTHRFCDVASKSYLEAPTGKKYMVLAFQEPKLYPWGERPRRRVS